MSGRDRIILLGVTAVVLLAGGCGRRASQPYAVTGTLSLSPSVNLNVPMLRARGMRTELRMTCRTSLDSADIVLQRRWIDAQPPHEFGIGKGRLDSLSHLDGIHVTARLDVYSQERLLRSVVAWTPKTVALGTRNVHLKLDTNLEDMAPGTGPTGGWWNDALPEDSPPPGLSSQDRGPAIFSGIIDVPDGDRGKLNNPIFQRAALFISAVMYEDRGAPELILRKIGVTFPYRFSLHDNDRIEGMGNAAIDRPYFISVRLDIDGNIGTQWDSVKVVTQERVAPGSDDVKLELPLGALQKSMKEFMEKNPPREETGGHAPVGSQGQVPKGTGAVVFGGAVLLAAGVQPPAGAVLYLSARDKDGQLALVKRVVPTSWPVIFNWTQEDFGSYKGDLAGKMTIKAMLSVSGDPLNPTAGDLATTVDAAGGTTGVVIELK